MNISIKREQNNARISSAEREKFGAKLKTKNIFKALALAMLMPAMLLTTACSNDDEAIVNNETTNKKGYALPVTVNVTRQDAAATRASFDGSKLNFGTGDQLFVKGNDNSAGGAGFFAGTLTWQSGGTFSGTILTENAYSGTIDALFTAGSALATLLPANYGNYPYLLFENEGTYSASINYDATKTFATSKATAVEQFSFEVGGYTSGTGFALHPANAILNFTITGLAANTGVDVALSEGGSFTISGSVTTDDLGTATFAAGVSVGTNLNNFSLTVAGNPITLVSSSKVLAAGKIYNIERKITDLSTITANYTASNGETLTGTLGSKVKISIADGATVILNNATISYSSNGADYAGLTLLGDGTIVLADGTTNTIIGGLDGSNYSNWPGIFVPAGKTLTINGNTGVLNAARGLPANDEGSPAGIGAAWGSNCGNIVINGGVINATGGNKGAGIGGCGRRGCGNITINGGTVTAISGDLAAGIGLGGTNNSSYADGGTCGDITISGGIIIATGGVWGAGIGTGFSANTKNVTVTKTCGNILISGGTITATGGDDAAGIGTGKTNTNGIINIGTITITNGVTRVTATKGNNAPNSIGKGSGTNITCGTVTIGGNVGAITDSPYTYQP